MVARLSLIKMRQVTFTVLTLNRCLCDFDRIMGIVCILSILFFLCQRNFLQIWAAQLTPWQVSLTHQSHQSKPAFFSGTVSPTEFCWLLGAVVAAPLRPPESHGRGHHGHGGSGSGFDAVATTWQWFITIQRSGNFEFCCIFFGAEFQETKPLRHSEPSWTIPWNLGTRNRLWSRSLWRSLWGFSWSSGQGQSAPGMGDPCEVTWRRWWLWFMMVMLMIIMVIILIWYY